MAMTSAIMRAARAAPINASRALSTHADVTYEEFGKLKFCDDTMRKAVSPDAYAAFHDSIKGGTKLPKQHGKEVSAALCKFALANGATQYAHWFSPLRYHDGRSSMACKFDGFLDLDFSDPNTLKPTVTKVFNQGLLFANETDGSSYPSGGLRVTHTAAAFVSWDKTSPPFVRGDTLYLPSGFITHYGEAMDHKTPLLRSQEVINKEGMRLLKHMGDTSAKEVVSNVGWEQEYFVIDQAMYTARPDLVASGRMLFGAISDRNQEGCENYFGIPNARAKAFMSDVTAECFRLGMTLTVNHNEVAPSQHELCPVFSLTNVAADQNSTIMEVLDAVGAEHGVKVLMHEKPFAGINGSGKHNNWGLNTDSGKNLFAPGKDAETQSDFMAFTAALAYAINNHGDVIRAAVACAGNDHRLGAQEAPPAVISLATGAALEQHIDTIIGGGDLPGYGTAGGDDVGFGTRAVQDVTRGLEDRNRTAPFPFCGNRYEFRAVGSSQNIAMPLAYLNAAVADGCAYVSSLIEGGASPRDAVAQTFKENYSCIFNGNGYDPAWLEEAAKRGLPNLHNCVESWRGFASEKNVKLFTSTGVFTEKEVHSRREIALDEYSNTLLIEGLCAVNMANTGFLPACAKDLGSYGSTGLEGERPATYKKMAELASELKAIVDAFPEDGDAMEKADYCVDHIKTKMNELREVTDAAERLCDKELWPYPKYDEILFHHHSDAAEF